MRTASVNTWRNGSSRGETVVDVRTTATARVRELSSGGRCKNDVLDASAAASVVAAHGDAALVAPEDETTVFALLEERRANLVRVQTSSRTIEVSPAVDNSWTSANALLPLPDRSAALLKRPGLIVRQHRIAVPGHQPRKGRPEVVVVHRVKLLPDARPVDEVVAQRVQCVAVDGALVVDVGVLAIRCHGPQGFNKPAAIPRNKQRDRRFGQGV